MATIKDMLDKEAYNRASIAEGLAQKIPPGKGGSPGQPYDPPKPTGPYVPAPKRDLANLRPQDFTPFDMDGVRDMDGFLLPHIRTPAIRDAEMEHFKRFIKNTGTSTWDLSQGNSSMMIANQDYEIERDILDARQNKKAREDAGKDMLLDEIFNKKNRKKGKA
tara:strand:- start:150 stop:638 length:489 start_codon:yes stop_codon:yes gene_type:complete